MRPYATRAGRLNSVGRVVVAGHLNLAYRRANLFARRHPEDDPADVEADALFGLVRAAVWFRDDGGATFLTYAWRAVGGAVLRGHRQRQRPEQAGGCLEWVLTDPPEPGGRLDARIACERLRRRLGPRLYRVLYLRHGLDWTLAEIGERYGVTKQRAGQLEAKAIARSRRI